ncbi:hypothetical protein FBQ97_02470 [Acidobacteria bacterium ACD]|nr:MAG: hypothetical protein EDX89_03570 [Acidobacteriota bacterium]MCE7956580.1 hypothetical protein [Acidobacteria bacterium ACB2]MDL1948665.1 hypothetical protein [Acidobacteria bacterium ACD]
MRNTRSSVATFLVVLATTLASFSASAQAARLVRDIVGGDKARGFETAYLTAAGRRLFYVARDESTGLEVWTSDGTPEGTRLVKDIFPGPGEPLSDPTGTCLSCFENPAPWALTSHGGLLYFLGSDGSSGLRLFVSDGTPDGTHLVGEETLATMPHGVRWLHSAGGSLWLLAGEGWSTDTELWKSDGTARGTAFVTRFAESGSGVRVLGSVGSTLLLAVKDGQHGTELWRSDGTASGTILVKDIAPGSASSFQLGASSDIPWYVLWPVPIATRDHLHFLADDGVHGQAIWRTDGTAAGTRRVGNFALRDTSLYWPKWAAIDDRLVFAASADEGGGLWVTSGEVREPALLAPLSVTAMASGGGVAYLGVTDAEQRPEIWRTDGTVEGTVKVSALATGSPTGRVLAPAVVNGRLFFWVSTPGAPSSLWTSDGTEAGTRRLGEIGLAWTWPTLSFAAAVEGRLFFAGGDANGSTVWVSDGTASGTIPLTRRRDPNSSRTRELFALPDRLYFDGIDELGEELWESDGTEGGTRRFADLLGGTGSSSPRGFTLFGARTWFFATAEGQRRLYSTNGNRWETTAVTTTDRGARVTFPPRPVATHDSILYLASQSSSQCCALMRLPAGSTTTEEVSSFPAGYDQIMIPFDKGAAFQGSTGTSSTGLVYVSDGTSGGTHAASDVRVPTGWPARRPLAATGRTLLFAGSTWTKRGVWSSDGTPEGTRLVLDGPASGWDSQDELTPVGRTFFFAAVDASRNAALFVTDGTSEGTRLLARFEAPPRALYFLPPALSNLTAARGKLFFAAWDAEHGHELWTSDGTVEGTRLLADILPGPSGSFPSSLTEVGNVLMLSASDGPHGAEPWTSDGTTTGTRMLADVAPGAGSSSPSLFAATCDDLFFVAFHPDSGRELWALAARDAGLTHAASAHHAHPCRTVPTDDSAGSPLPR